MTAFALLISLYTLCALVLPGFGPPFLADRRAVVPLWLSAHLVGALVALAVGPWQLNQRLRSRAIRWHRWMGRAYVVAVLVGGIGALGLAPLSQEGMVTHIGFGLLGVLWLGTTLQAYRRIRAGDQTSHRRWMVRSYALTYAAVTLRIYLPLSQIAGVSFATAYQVIAWLCWVPNLIVAEWWLATRTSASEHPFGPK